MSGIFSSAIGWIVVSVLGALATHTMAIRYGASKYSVFVAAVAFGSIVENFTDLGLFQVLQRDIARDRPSASYRMGLTLGLRLTLNAVVVPTAIALAFALYRHQSLSLRISVSLILVALPLAAVQQVVLAYYAATARLVTVAFFGVVKQLTFFAIVLVVIIGHFSVVYCVAASLAGSVFSAIIALCSVRREIRLRVVVDFQKWKTMFTETASIGLTSILGSFYLNADILLLSVLVTSSQLGYYGASYAVISVFQVVPSLLSRALLNKVVHTPDEELATTVNKLIVHYAVAGALIASLAIVGGSTVIKLYAGSHFASAVRPLQILSCGQIFLFMSSGLSNISVARGFHRRLFQRGIIGLLLNVIINLAVIPFYGIRGSAAATTFCELVLSMVLARIIRRDLSVTTHIFRASWRPITSALIPVLALWHWYERGTESFLNGITLMTLTFFMFVGSLFLLRGVPKEVMHLMREFTLNRDSKRR